jgi:NTE family protein
MPTRFPICCILGILALAAPAAVPQTQAPPPPKTPKIGLVLEGGAALGLAHIGVVQWLEENRIPVNYVAGTSMGGLIGGMYATGNSPAEIRSLVEGIDWNEVMRGEVPYGDLPFRRKQDAEDFPNGIEFGIKHGVRLRSGFNSGHQVGLILDRVALPYSEIKEFDDLPIPFACVGTDLVNNKPHVFRNGSLSQALRSTMSLPGVFTPVRANGTVYVDGGLLDNLPVDVAQQLGADLTIAVHLEVKPLGANEPLSSVGVLGRSISVVIAANELASMQKADILISVPLGKFSSTDYEKYEEIIKLGYEAAASKASVLSRFSVDEATWQAYLAQRSARKKTAASPQFVEVAGTKPMLVKEIQNKLADTLDKPIDSPELDKKLTYLMGDGRFASIGYEMTGKDGRAGLLIHAREKEYSPPTVLPLFVIDGSEVERVQFMVGARITFLDLGKFGTEWRNDLILGSEHGAQSEFYLPLDKQLRWFIAPRGYAAKTALDFYNGDNLVAEYRDRVSGGAVDFGFVPTRDSQIRIGYQGGYEKLAPTIGSLPYGSLQGRTGATYLRYNLDRRDSPIIPRDGTDVLFRGEWHDSNPGAVSGYPVAEALLTKFKPLNAPSSIFATVAGGSTFSYHQTGFPPFELGGGPYLLAYGKNEFLAHQYMMFRAGYVHKLFDLPVLIGDKAYAIGTLEGAKLYGIPSNVSSLPGDAAVGIIINTIFGPFTIGGGFGATGHVKLFYQLGRVF